ncbi:MAG: hypothetical protein JXP34_08305 [Planctomycetes bacterium]|nr:hypothetical protein [Planctomycetota bacterium]
MKTERMIAMLILSAAPSLRAAAVLERWCGEGRAAHAGTLSIEERDGAIVLRFDLSALPRAARIRRAWLTIEKDGGQPYRPILIEAIGNERDRRRLVLEPPWYRRFVATDAVRAWVADPRRNRGFAVEPFEGFRPEASALEIQYDGEPRDVPPQVTGLRVVHHDGQTFIVWTEHPAFRPAPEEVIWVEKFAEKGDVLAKGPGAGAFGMPNHPGITLRTLRRLQGLGLRDTKSGFQGIRPLRRVAEVEPVAYRVYRHGERITAQNIADAQLLATVDPLSGYDRDVYAIHFTGEYLDQWEEPDSVIPTYATDSGKALAAGQGLYVHTPVRAGAACYAVTMVLAGTENLADFGDGNRLDAPIGETPAKPLPILQWMQEDFYKRDPVEYWYRLWAAPPLHNLPSRSFRIGVAVSDRFEGPGPLSIGSISGDFNLRGEINVPREDRVTLRIEDQLPWLPALFYNEGRGTLRAATECRVDAYCERYVETVIEWIFSKYAIDRSRIDGSLMYFGLRHPEIFPKMSFGTYTATYDYRWAPGNPDHLGPEGIRTVDGDDAWEMYSVGGYVSKYPDRDIPFFICISGTGKDSGHTSEFGWQDDPRGWRALLDARQPFAAAWSGESHRYPAFRRFDALNWEGTIPAFSNGSLDDNPGNGDPADGDYYGQINGYLLWDDEDRIDESDRWEMTLFVLDECSREGCTVDVTPRHCARFEPKPGERFAWTNALPDGRRVATGETKADRWGLVTIPRLILTKARHRVALRRAP